MKQYLCYALLLAAFSCSSHDDLSKEEAAIKIACEKCNMSSSEMNWLRTKIVAAESDMGKATAIYAVETSSKGVVIIDQPVVMSCLACGRYDCQGNIIGDVSSEFIQELQSRMSKETMLYSTY